MNTIQKFVQKALGLERLPESGLWGSADWDFTAPDTTDEAFNEALRKADQSSVVQGCLKFLISNAMTPKLAVSDAEGEAFTDHDALEPLKQWNWLLPLIIQSLVYNGNAYIKKVGNRLGDITDLQFLSYNAIELDIVKSTGQLRRYIYTVDGIKYPIEVDEMIHIRYWGDPHRTHLGRSLLYGLGPEIHLDIEATRTVASIMKNRGMPGGIISPEDDINRLSADDIAQARKYIRENYTGENRGNWMVFGSKMRTQLVDHNAAIFDMSHQWEHAEERVCSAFGLPPIVVSFSAGTTQSRVGTATKELERQAWQGGVIPMLTLITQQITDQLPMPEGLTLTNDFSEVTALQEDASSEVERLARGVLGGIITVAEARETLGFDIRPTDEIYLRPASALEVPVGETAEDVTARLNEAMPDENDTPFGNDDDDSSTSDD